MRSISELQLIFNHALKEQQFSGTTSLLYEPFYYILGLEGKRMRPVMLLLACEMFGEDASKALPQAIAIELFHNFTLIHDDIMDHAPLRRGLPAVHEKFDEAAAILSGDAMLVYAYKYITQADVSIIPELIHLFNDCAIKVCEGQQMDMSFEKTDQLSATDYLRMVELKTATLFATSLRMGAVIAGAAAEDADHLYHFGLHLGISFQLKDDWLDSFGYAEKVGKQTGGDITQNKKTFLFIEAINRADELTANELRSFYADDSLNAGDKIKAVQGIFSRLDIATVIESEMKKHYDQATEHLNAISLDGKVKKPLHDLAGQLRYRDR